MHSDPEEGSLPWYENKSYFCKGGFNKFDYTNAKTPIDKALNFARQDWYGWIGNGGSVMQWNRKTKAGFVYLPGDLYKMDNFGMLRAGLI